MIITPLPEEWSKEFDKKFPCVEDGCDNNGTISGYDRDGYREVQQCQWCFEKRLPIKDFISSFLHQSYEQGKREMGEKTIKWMTKQGYEGLQKEYKNSLTNERKEEE